MQILKCDTIACLCVACGGISVTGRACVREDTHNVQPQTNTDEQIEIHFHILLKQKRILHATCVI